MTEVLDLDISDPPDTEENKYCREHKKDAKRKMEQILGVEIRPGVKIVEPHSKYLVTLPDGLIGDNKIVQIKCPYKCARLVTIIIFILL